MRDTIARQLDVDKKSVKMVVDPGKGKYRNGTITFQCKEGKALDLARLHASLKATRLSGGTRSAVNYLQITAKGEVTVSGKQTLLNVSGTPQQFELVDDPKAKPKKGTQSPFQRLRAALAKGEKLMVVTGRVQGWSGHWPKVLRALPGQPAEDAKDPEKAAAKKPPLLIVREFQTATK